MKEYGFMLCYILFCKCICNAALLLHTRTRVKSTFFHQKKAAACIKYETEFMLFHMHTRTNIYIDVF